MCDTPFPGEAPFLCGIDPRFRIVVATAYAIALAVIQSLPAACLGVVFAFAFLLLARPNPGATCKRLAIINIFIVFLWISVPLTMGGDSIAALGPFHVSRAGIFLALLVALKCNAIAFVFIALVAPITISVLAHSLERLRFPTKLVFLLLFAYRYIYVIEEEWKRLYTAAKLRGFRPKTNVRTYGVLANMLGMVFVHSFERSARVYEAMQLRGFCGKFRSIATFQSRLRDFVFTGVAAAALGSIILLDIFPGKFHG